MQQLREPDWEMYSTTDALFLTSPVPTSQYCQNIRNNTRRGRTPKWAVKLGLVKVKDPRAGKHQWAGRYDGMILRANRARIVC